MLERDPVRVTRPLVLGIAATTLAIAITTTMDASGLTALSALPLFPIAALLWWATRSPRDSLGLTLARWRYHVIALAYPVAVLGACTVLSLGTGAANLARIDWGKATLNVVVGAAGTALVALLTEEGFFRGALWAALRDARLSPAICLLGSSIAFAIWHISAVTLPTGFDLPRGQIPIFLMNAAVMGGIWGVLRWTSGSILVSSVSHGAWNGVAYALFGYGTKIGALGVVHTGIYGPEVGIVGLTLNISAFLVLVAWSRRHFPNAITTGPEQLSVAAHDAGA
jgi:uncharacterized protein